MLKRDVLKRQLELLILQSLLLRQNSRWAVNPVREGYIEDEVLNMVT